MRFLIAIMIGVLYLGSCGGDKDKKDRILTPTEIKVQVDELGPAVKDIQRDFAARKTKVEEAREAYKKLAADDLPGKSTQVFNAALEHDEAQDKLLKHQKKLSAIEAQLARTEISGEKVSKAKAALEKAQADTEGLKAQFDEIEAIQKEITDLANKEMDEIFASVPALAVIVQAKATLGKAKEARTVADASVKSLKEEKKNLEKAQKAFADAQDEQAIRAAALQAKFDPQSLTNALAETRSPAALLSGLKLIAGSIEAEQVKVLTEKAENMAKDDKTKKAIEAFNAYNDTKSNLRLKIKANSFATVERLAQEIADFTGGAYWDKKAQDKLAGLSKDFASQLSDEAEKLRLTQAITKFESVEPSVVVFSQHPLTPLRDELKEMVKGLYEPIAALNELVDKSFKNYELLKADYEPYQKELAAAAKKDEELSKQIDEAIGTEAYDSKEKVQEAAAKVIKVLGENSKAKIDEVFDTGLASQKVYLEAAVQKKLGELDERIAQAAKAQKEAITAVTQAKAQVAVAEKAEGADSPALRAAIVNAATLQLDGPAKRFVALLSDAALASKAAELKTVAKSFRKMATDAHKLRKALAADDEPIKGLLAAIAQARPKISTAPQNVKSAVNNFVEGIKILLMEKSEREKLKDVTKQGPKPEQPQQAPTTPEQPQQVPTPPEQTQQ